MNESITNDQSQTMSLDNFIDTKDRFIVETEGNFGTIEEQNNKEEAIQIEQNKVKVNLVNINFEITTVGSILGNKSTIKPRDNSILIKITIKVRAVHLYKWTIYHTSKEIILNINELVKIIDKEKIALNPDISEYFKKIKKYDVVELNRNLNEVEQLYKSLFQVNEIKNNIIFKEFFEIGLGSFNQYNNGNKPLEGYVEKQEEPYCFKNFLLCVGKCIECLSYRYNKRWVVVKDDSIYYSIKSDSEQGRDTYFFENDTEILRSGENKIMIRTSGKELILKLKNFFQREYWFNEISKRADKIKSLIEHNIYGSFTNEKSKNLAHWFADGEDYFSDLYKNLMEAKDTIFITDWWMSPEVWLIRPIKVEVYDSMAYHNENKKEEPPYSRLMDVLYQKALKGVKIYILVYSECSIALSLQSKHTQDALEQLHENIIVTRHPDSFITKDIFWSHHEKLVIIDQKLAYVGGLDLCWGRWDTHSHPLIEIENEKKEYYFPGIDYSNARIIDFSNVDKYLFESVPRNNKPRMPWHDVHTRLIGPVVSDIARHFVQRWNFSRARDQAITNIKQNESTKKQVRRGIKIKEEENQENDNVFEVRIIHEQQNKKDENTFI